MVQNVKEAAGEPAASFDVICLQGSDVLCLFALSAGSHVELDLLPFGQRLVATALDVGVVDEDIIALFTRDKAKALLGIKKFHSSGSQLTLTFRCATPGLRARNYTLPV
jgi:hypothetical protein